ncbi:MAG: phosphatase PAP2 family protein [Saprospiraceae bacterium]|nr:phosphatase PAP2 family protein [Saprospiraceae bacterium]
MKEIFRDNSWYFVGFGFVLIFAMGIWTQVEQLDPLYFFSERRSGWLNHLFIYATMLGEPLSFVLAFIVFLFIKYRYALLVAAAGAFTLFISWGLKVLFQSARPGLVIRDSGIMDQFVFIEGVEMNVGFTSFPSGHTFAAFTIFTLIALLSTHKNWWAICCLVLATAVAISRMYLLHHFLADVIAGAVIGTSIAVILYWMQEYVILRRHPKLERKLHLRFMRKVT